MSSGVAQWDGSLASVLQISVTLGLISLVACGEGFQCRLFGGTCLRIITISPGCKAGG